MDLAKNRSAPRSDCHPDQGRSPIQPPIRESNPPTPLQVGLYADSDAIHWTTRLAEMLAVSEVFAEVESLRKGGVKKSEVFAELES